MDQGQADMDPDFLDHINHGQLDIDHLVWDIPVILVIQG